MEDGLSVPKMSLLCASAGIHGALTSESNQSNEFSLNKFLGWPSVRHTRPSVLQTRAIKGDLSNDRLHSDGSNKNNQICNPDHSVNVSLDQAKMTAITKGAIRAIKFYKHIVQSVEKFIQKCKPEYKIPGLYVIDSIVRQVSIFLSKALSCFSRFLSLSVSSPRYRYTFKNNFH